MKLYILATSWSTNKISTFIPIGPANPTAAPVASLTASSLAISNSITSPIALAILTSLASLSPLNTTATTLSSAWNIKVFAIFFGEHSKNFAKSSIDLTAGVSTFSTSINSSFSACSGVDGAFSMLAA